METTEISDTERKWCKASDKLIGIAAWAAQELIAGRDRPELKQKIGKRVQSLFARSCSLSAWPRPIPVSERLPEEAEECLVNLRRESDGFDSWGLADQVGGVWRVWGEFLQVDDEGTVTHWLPLPPKPE